MLSINGCFGKKLNQCSLCQVYLHYILCSITLKLSLQTRSRAKLNLASGFSFTLNKYHFFFVCIYCVMGICFIYLFFSLRTKLRIHNTVTPLTFSCHTGLFSVLKTIEFFLLSSQALCKCSSLCLDLFLPHYSVLFTQLTLIHSLNLNYHSLSW